MNNKGTSRTTFALKVSNIDLPSPLPASVGVEVAFGGVIASEDVPLTTGKFVDKKIAPLTSRLFLDKIKSTSPVGGERTTVVKGRLAAEGGVGLVDGFGFVYPIFPTVFWGIAVAVHGVTAYRPRHTDPAPPEGDMPRGGA